MFYEREIMTGTMWAAIGVFIVLVTIILCWCHRHDTRKAAKEAAKVDNRKRFAVPRRRPMQTVRMWDAHWQTYHTVSVVFAAPLHEIEQDLDHREMKRRYDARNDNR